MKVKLISAVMAAAVASTSFVSAYALSRLLDFFDYSTVKLGIVAHVAQ